MSELFGGFPAAWPAAYHDAAPIDEAYGRFRRALYQLYYLLVHVNLFGASYESACLRAAKEALRG
jgi:fructosamine-3-kinase